MFYKFFYQCTPPFFLRVYKSVKKHQPSIFPITVAFVLLIIYNKTLLLGTGYSGDTAKFQFLGKVLGTPHATGYPTYIVLNHIFVNLFPFGDLAYKANFLSALLSVVSVIILWKILYLLGIDAFIASISSFSFGLTYTLWSQSLIAEVYTLNLLFVSLVIFYFLKWEKSGTQKNFLIACAFYAASFGNHLTMITFLPAIVVLVLKSNKKINTKNIVYVGIFILLGAMQYLYVFWRAYDTHPYYVEMNPHNINEFLWFIRGAQFENLMFAFSPSFLFSKRIPMLLELLNREFPFFILLPIIGYFTFEHNLVRFFLLLGVLGNCFFALNYNIPDVYVYFLPSYFIIEIFFAQGLNWLWMKLSFTINFKEMMVLFHTFPIDRRGGGNRTGIS